MSKIEKNYTKIQRKCENLETEIDGVQGAVKFFLILTVNQPTGAGKIENV